MLMVDANSFQILEENCSYVNCACVFFQWQQNGRWGRGLQRSHPQPPPQINNLTPFVDLALWRREDCVNIICQSQ